MKEALEKTEFKESFMEQSIRNWVVSTSGSDQDAADRLGNSVDIARKHYRNKPNVVTPLICRKAKG